MAVLGAFGGLMRRPIFQALALQIPAAVLQVLLWLAVLKWFPTAHPTLLAVLFAQGLFAALLAGWRGMAWWWWLLLFVFPFAVWGVRLLSVPPWVFLSAFVLLGLAYWHTFRTQVPYYPSHRAVWQLIGDNLPADRPLRVLDVGSGLGGLLLYLAARFPQCQATGIELSPLPWLISVVRAKLLHSHANFVHGDYVRLDFSAYDVLFAYLSPAAMPQLWHKVASEMRPGAVLFSYEFGIPDRPPDRSFRSSEMGAPLYAWYI